jgi:cytochrome c oxidase assembly factor CtaG
VSTRHESAAQRALAVSTAALALAVACVLAFMPTLFERFLVTPLRTSLVALLLAAAALLHWAFLGIGVRRLGRPLAGWLALAVLLFPIGGAAALMLLAWLEDEPPQPLAAR